LIFLPRQLLREYRRQFFFDRQNGREFYGQVGSQDKV
jgi:hypothetical protein